jgi:hypothetical protein
MPDCRRFQKFVRNAPRGASRVFCFDKILLVKHFLKMGRGKTDIALMGGINLFCNGFERAAHPMRAAGYPG